MDNRPIGVFDSGIGGLTAVRALRSLLPGEDIVYFGDTGRIPYGTRSEDIIIKYAMQDIDFLMKNDVKLIMAACGTVSSILPKRQSESIGVPYIGVVEAAAAAAAQKTQNNKVCVLGTQATIKSGSYAKELAKLNKDIEVMGIACPLFVPLVENGYIDPQCKIAHLVAEEYLEDCIKFGADTVILGCTHYPLLSCTISDILGEKVQLINPGEQQAEKAKIFMQQKEMLSVNQSGGECKYFVSDDINGFVKMSKMFLKEYAGGECRLVSVD